MSKTLRRFAVTAALMLLVSAPSMAQSVQGGIKGGISFTTLDGLGEVIGNLPEVNVESRINYVAGVFVKVNLGTFFAFQPEVLYVRKGAKLAATGVFTESITYNLNYIDIPLLARVQTSRGTGLYLLAGPSIGLNVTATVEDEAGETEDVKDGINTSDMGLVIGAGVELAHILVEGRYTQGLSNIIKDAEGEESVKNRAISLLFGIRF
jgi:hypothetical protein